ncbi:hypothetical protein [Spiroplasma endosymbiont of Polydrusus formosus]|uniref:hypothetical protein n=1 Tax=Spiroplasma endosymbiont of Polydrusus formosus TaxID=3139326 RepID=UPI0035B545D9
MSVFKCQYFNVSISDNYYCDDFSDELCVNLKIKKDSLNYLEWLNKKIIFKIITQQNHEFEKRNTTPSILNLLTTIDIGTM